jgi:hypothetical protein
LVGGGAEPQRQIVSARYGVLLKVRISFARKSSTVYKDEKIQKNFLLCRLPEFISENAGTNCLFWALDAELASI